jgi:hypothetical protein
MEERGQPGPPPAPPEGAGLARIVRWTKPRHYGDVAVAHLPLAFFAGALIGFSWLHARLAVNLQSCSLLRLTGIPCPFCGSSRSFAAMATGAWGQAWLNSPLACVLFVLVCAVFAWNAAALVLRVRLIRGEWLRLGTPRRRWVAGLLAAGLIAANWIYRLVNGFQ